jgi:hypothetical protein
MTGIDGSWSKPSNLSKQQKKPLPDVDNGCQDSRGGEI